MISFTHVFTSLLLSGCKFNSALQLLAIKCFSHRYQKVWPPRSVLSAQHAKLHSPFSASVPWVGNAAGCYYDPYCTTFMWKHSRQETQHLSYVLTYSILWHPNQQHSFISLLYTGTDTRTPTSRCLTHLASSDVLMWLRDVVCKCLLYANCLRYANQCIK